MLRVASGVIAHLRGAAPGQVHAQVLHSMNAIKVTPDHTRVLVHDAREHSRMVVSTYGLDSSHGFSVPGAPPASRPSGSRTTMK